MKVIYTIVVVKSIELECVEDIRAFGMRKH